MLSRCLEVALAGRFETANNRVLAAAWKINQKQPEGGSGCAPLPQPSSQPHLRSGTSKKMTARARIPIIVGAMIANAGPTQGHVAAHPAQPKLEAQIAKLAARTVALVAAARSPQSPQQRLSAPTVIWRVPGALPSSRTARLPACGRDTGRRLLDGNCPPPSRERKPGTASPSRLRSRSASSRSPSANGMPASGMAAATAIGRTTRAGDGGNVRSSMSPGRTPRPM